MCVLGWKDSEPLPTPRLRGGHRAGMRMPAPPLVQLHVNGSRSGVAARLETLSLLIAPNSKPPDNETRGQRTSLLCLVQG